MVSPRKSIWPGGAGCTERSAAGAETVGRTRSKVMKATSRGMVTMSAVRRTFWRGSTMTRWMGALNCFQRSSESLTQISTPTTTVPMYCRTTVAGTGALATPKRGGRSQMPHSKRTYASTTTIAAWPSGCFQGLVFIDSPPSRRASYLCDAMNCTIASSSAAGMLPKIGGIIPSIASNPLGRRRGRIEDGRPDFVGGQARCPCPRRTVPAAIAR